MFRKINTIASESTAARTRRRVSWVPVAGSAPEAASAHEPSGGAALSPPVSMLAPLEVGKGSRLVAVTAFASVAEVANSFSALSPCDIGAHFESLAVTITSE